MDGTLVKGKHGPPREYALVLLCEQGLRLKMWQYALATGVFMLDCDAISFCIAVLKLFLRKDIDIEKIVWMPL